MAIARRIFPLLGGASGALLAAVFMPTALGHAADSEDVPYETCDGAVCLVQDPGYATPDWYSGIRPFVTDWHGTQPFTVENDGDALGSYSITLEDTWTPFYSVWHYDYGDFTPAAGVTDPDLGAFAGQSGASVYDASLLGGKVDFLTLIDVNVHGHELSYYETSFGDFTNVSVVDTADGTSGDYIQVGDSDPQWLYNSLFHGEQFPAVPDYLVPADVFAQQDFDPSQYFDGGDLAAM
jgi:hypothetical protein